MNEKFPNIINQDGEVISYGKIFSDELSAQIFDELSNKISWMNETVIMFGKAITTKRKVAFYANEGISYTYSKITKNALQWLPALEQVKLTIEQYTGQKYNACLLNYYHNGNEGMGWHADNERELGINPVIASVSLGSARRFDLKHTTTGELKQLILPHGSLLLMGGTMQHNWKHCIAKTTKIHQPRINLTFRMLV